MAQKHSWSRHSTESSTKRGYGYAWQQLRVRVLARDYGLCQSCIRQGRTTPANHVDHIRPKSDGGLDEMENLQSLCAPCHGTKSILETGGDPRSAIGLDGWPVEDVATYVGPLWRGGRLVR